MNSPVPNHIYDLCIIGGGINGTGIARDAAGRGLSVLLLEAGDLGGATSSASTKLIHGGLRYLEQYEFRLVAESLREREILLKSARHIIRPLEFILPHEPSLRPFWMIRLGLLFYDRMKKRAVLPASKAINLQGNNVLAERFTRGFSYHDCRTDDARLVVLNALDAAHKGAVIRVRTECLKLEPLMDKKMWHISYRDLERNEMDTATARAVINVTGPWVRKILNKNNLVLSETPGVRLVKGSHIMVPKLYEGRCAYILQQPDRRVVFAIPFEEQFTLIGTTDSHYSGDPAQVKISPEEVEYLCTAVSRFFIKTIKPADIVWSYSGVRSLVDSGDEKLSEITRDYKLDLTYAHGPPLLNVFGGKLTTYRKLAEHALEKLESSFLEMKPAWTQDAFLPGGDIADYLPWFHGQEALYPWLSPVVLRRYARSYGTRINFILQGASSLTDLGVHYGDHVYEAEIRYLVREEWARTVEDILWRRSKLGLHVKPETVAALQAVLPNILQEEV